jgi:hypothetical protein
MKPALTSILSSVLAMQEPHEDHDGDLMPALTEAAMVVGDEVSDFAARLADAGLIREKWVWTSKGRNLKEALDELVDHADAHYPER